MTLAAASAMVPGTMQTSLRTQLRLAARTRQPAIITFGAGMVRGVVEHTGRYTQIADGGQTGGPPTFWTVKTSAILAVGLGDHATPPAPAPGPPAGDANLERQLAELEDRVNARLTAVVTARAGSVAP